MRAYATDGFHLPLPPGHRFPIGKYALLRERLIGDRVLEPPAVEVPPAATHADLIRAHASEYVEAVFAGTLSRSAMRRIGFPWSHALVERSRRSVGATMSACRTALAEGLAISLAGGTHHAGPDWGEGYCVFNDVAVAVRVQQASGRARRVLIVDADVHQGNGTAAIFAFDSSVYTFDIFGERNFPFTKIPADRDIALADGTGDQEYLERFAEGLDAVYKDVVPDLVVYLAGADPFAGDRLGRLAMTKDGLKVRDRLVVERCVALGVPLAVVMAGGYGARVEDTVDIHVQTISVMVESSRSTTFEILR